jgi:hypothetical protein
VNFLPVFGRYSNNKIVIARSVLFRCTYALVLLFFYEKVSLDQRLSFSKVEFIFLLNFIVIGLVLEGIIHMQTLIYKFLINSNILFSLS